MQRSRFLLRRCAGLAALASSIVGPVACGKATYSPPQTAVQLRQHERVVAKSFDDAWTALIDYTSQAFFAIDRFEKASGLMTLSFGSSAPATYIDCGRMKFEALGRSVDAPYAEYLSEQFGAKLDGKMNLVVRSLDPVHTQVRVNARYIFSAHAETLSLVPVQTWTFDSGGEATIEVAQPTSGTAPSRTCRPTYAAERALLDAVAK